MSADCNCGGSCCQKKTRPSRSRDEPLPPSSRRGERIGYRFATVAALIRGARMSPPVAARLVDDWTPYVRYRMLAGKSPESTAGHLIRFEAQGLARPPLRSRDARTNIKRRSKTKRTRDASTSSSGYDVARYSSGKSYLTESSGRPDYTSKRTAAHAVDEANIEWERRGRPTLSQELSQFFAPARDAHHPRTKRPRRKRTRS